MTCQKRPSPGRFWQVMETDDGNIGISVRIQATVVATVRGNNTAQGRMRAAHCDLP